MKPYILFALLLAVSLPTACEKGPEYVAALELGCDETEHTATCAAGSHDFAVLSDGNYTATLPDDVSWAVLDDADDGKHLSRRGDGPLSVSYAANRGLSRTVRILLSNGKRSLTLTLVQQGLLSQSLALEDRKIFIGDEGGRQYAKLLTTFSPQELNFEVGYGAEEPEGWISGIALENNYLTFTAQPNYSESACRHATIAIAATDEEGTDYTGQLSVTQDFAGNTPQELSFDALCALVSATQPERTLDGPHILNGLVINDNSCGNGAENRNFSAILQDLTLAQRTLYVEDAATAGRGIRVELENAADNPTRRYDRISLALDGLKLTREGGTTADDPVRYVLSGATAAHLLTVSAGSAADMPVKRKRLAELTDEDLYTFVTLTDCEIPIRKGPFMPIDLRHRQLLNKYPMVFRDKQGATSHLMINTVCTFARNGEPMPQGSGEISGVVVHETCDQFEWDKLAATRMAANGIASDYIVHIGPIGRYQIRPLSREDIALAERFEEGFSEMICEFRYYNKLYDALVKNVTADNTVYSTYPAVADPLTSEEINGRLYCETTAGVRGNLLSKRDWTHLGPVVDNIITDPANGNGVTDYYGTSAHWSVYSSVATTAILLEANGSAWYSSAGLGTGKYWCAEFSTQGIDASHSPMSVQAGVVNGYGSNVGAPRYWAMEYSTDGKATWTRIAEYTVPDFPIVANKRSWQCPGHKYISVTLPSDADIWDKEQVCIRLIPTQNTAGSADAYDGAAIVSGQDTSLNYFAVRYNK